MNAWFVTGTDTGAGKTACATAILLAGRARGLRVRGYKPIESGCPATGQGPDTLALAAAARQDPECSYSLRDPVAPSLAAARQGIHIELDTILRRAEELQREADLLIVEGAGGFLAPLSELETIADLATPLGLPILIVASDKLGAINHCLLTIEAATRRGLTVAALILSAPDPATGASDALDNAAQLRVHTEISVLQLPRCYTDSEWLKAGQQLLSELLLADAKT